MPGGQRWRTVPVAPLLWFIGLTLALAMIGGGWLALRRVDPLLAVPGMLLAAMAALAFARGAAIGVAYMGAAAAGMLMLLTVIALMMSGPMPWAALALTAVAAGAALLLAQRIISGLRTLWRTGGFVRRAGAAGLLMLALFGWQAAAWAVLPLAYRWPQPGAAPMIAVMTSLDAFTPAAPVVMASAGRVRWQMVTVFPAPGDATADGLLLAHPGALSPGQLVAIDNWVRRGGRIVVLADGLSSWPARYPIGDPRNPPITSLLTPLLHHWGLELDAPAGLSEDIVEVRDGTERLALFTAGTFSNEGTARGPDSGRCRLSAGKRIARCRIGAGQAVLLADADFLTPELWAGEAIGSGPASWRAGNISWLTDQVTGGKAGGSAQPIAQPLWIR